MSRLRLGARSLSEVDDCAATEISDEQRCAYSETFLAALTSVRD